MKSDPPISNRDPLQNEMSSYSIGTAFAIDGLEKTFRKSGSDLIAINIATLIRNQMNSNKNMRLSELREKLKRELFVLLEDLYGIISSRRTPANILMYLIDYENALPEIARRPDTPPRIEFRKAVKFFIREIMRDQGANQTINMNGIEVRYVVLQRKVLPHKMLLPYVNRMSPIRQVTLISHCDPDYHIGRDLKVFNVLQSHTGKIVPYSELGKKIFKKNHLPFNPLTHAFLGDKDFIKGCLGIKERKELYAMAEKRNWDMKSYYSVMDDLKSLGHRPHIDFT